MSSQPPTVKSLALKHIKVDESIQPRADGLHEPTVREYAAEMEGGAEFPAVVVYHANGVNWLSEGFHRVAAAESIRQTHITAEVRKGGRLEALINAAGSNRHGLKRTNKDKRRAVIMLLTECPDWSDRRIADACGVSQPFVSGVRPKQSSSTQSVITVITQQDETTNTVTDEVLTVNTPDAATNDDVTPDHAEQSNEISVSKADDPAPQVSNDAAGEKPPEHPADVFASKLAELCRRIDGCKASAKEAAAEAPYGGHVHAESVVLQLETARKALWQSRPTEACNCVRGDKPAAADCKACFGTGRTTPARVLKGGR